MTNSQILKDRITKQCEIQGKSKTTMLSELSLGVNAINQINEKKGMGSFVLAQIANYLNCSVDYLLGRTDNPDTSVAVDKNNEMTTELLKKFQALSFDDKIDVLNIVIEKSRK